MTLRARPSVAGDVSASCKRCTIQETLQPSAAYLGCLIRRPPRLWASPLCSGHNGGKREQSAQDSRSAWPAVLPSGRPAAQAGACCWRLCGFLDGCANRGCARLYRKMSLKVNSTRCLSLCTKRKVTADAAALRLTGKKQRHRGSSLTNHAPVRWVETAASLCVLLVIMGVLLLTFSQIHVNQI